MSTPHIQEALITDKCLAFRVSKVPGLCIESLWHYLEDDYDGLVISSEKHPIQHLHGIVMINSRLVDMEEEQINLRKKIKLCYPSAKGNKNLYTAKVRSIKQCFKYTLKEGDFKYKGFVKSYVEEMFLLSVPKDSLADKILENEENLLLKKIDFEQFKMNYIQIKVDHNQNLYVNHIRSYFYRFYVKSGAISTLEFLNYYLDLQPTARYN